MKAVFLDRDGTVIAGAPKYERVDSVKKVEVLPNTLEALAKLAVLDFGVFFVTNQAGLGEGLITIEEFRSINNKVLELIEPSNIQILKTYYCPHGVDAHCACRKPKPKLLLDAAEEFDVDLSASFMVGDRESDVLTGIGAGTHTILVDTGMKPTSATVADYEAADLLEAVNYIAEQQLL